MTLESKRLITAALPYANGDLHLGGIRSTYLPADIYARFCRLKGYQTVFACATDEHGTPIEVNAQKEGLKPEEFVVKYHERQKRDFVDLGISFDIFHHTHSPENEKLSAEFYRAAEKKGFTYVKEVEQTFCENCSRFLPDRFVKGTCPFCDAADQYGDGCEKCGKVYTPKDLKTPQCAICGKNPTTKKVEHVFFRLSALEKELRAFLENPALQKDVVNYVKNWLKDL
ncbi:MAG TPA: class I tRNA ligase family protein, partial [Candidatus Norongarragalinales archaeon]|nr:class I tRNA ligase family protein [Candidatus Norongarragalinales archaeon]